jgi:hypothetical protein
MEARNWTWHQVLTQTKIELKLKPTINDNDK